MNLIEHFKTTYNEVNEDSLIVFNGEITQEIVHSFTALVGQTMTLIGADEKPKKKVYHVLVELLQNICKHSGYRTIPANDDEENESQVGLGMAIFGYDQNNFIICTGNKIKNENIAGLKEMIDHINSLDKMGLKELYKFMIKKSRLSERGGAGLGYIDIAKKNLQKYDYEFVELNSEESMFILSYNIPKPVEA